MTTINALVSPLEAAQAARVWRIAAREEGIPAAETLARVEAAAWWQTLADTGDVPDRHDGAA